MGRLLIPLTLDYFFEYITKSIPITILELFAAIAGTYYLQKKPNTLKINKFFVYLLWYTFINEFVASYSLIGYFSEYKYLGFIEGTLFERNFWLYNIYSIINFSFLIYYFNAYFSDNKSKMITKYFLFAFVFSSITYLIVTDVFFKSYSNFTTAVGTILLLTSIFFFYFRLLKTDKVIILKYFLPIYLSIGALFFNLCITPIDLFSQYFKRINALYVSLHINLLLIANIFMYTTFIIGFLICAKKEKETVA